MRKHPEGYNVNLPADGPVRPAIPPKAPPMRPVPPAVAAYTLEERQRLLDRIAQLEGALSAFRESVPDDRHADLSPVDPFHIEPAVLAMIDKALKP